MKSSLAKGLHKVAGKPMVNHVVDAVTRAGVDRVVVVVGYQAELMSGYLGDRTELVYQAEQLGTGHAVLQTRDVLSGTDADILVVACDVPLLTPEVLLSLIEHHQETSAAATLLSARVDDPSGYGRVVRDREGRFQQIIEQADIEVGDVEEIDEINSGICVVRASLLYEFLAQLETDNAQDKYYLIDIFSKLRQQGFDVRVVESPDAEAVMGVNDRAALARAGAVLRQRINHRLMLAGVSIIDPATTHIDAGVEIAPDTTIHPFTTLRGSTRIDGLCEIGPGSDIVDSKIGPETTVLRSTIEVSQIGARVKIGPYAHLRPGSQLADDVKVGNYAEIKNSSVGKGSKISHHSYIGDTDIGADVNMGAGVVTVNYDGYAKHRTVIEDGAFIGCNVNLVAPVRIEAGAYVAAGSTVTTDVPVGALGVARSHQRNIEGWVARWDRRHRER